MNIVVHVKLAACEQALRATKKAWNQTEASIQLTTNY